MDLRLRKRFFYTIWFLLLLIPVLTLSKNTDFNSNFSNPVIFFNSFQRLTGMTAFVLIFIQIILGSFMDRWVQVIGSKAYKLHTTQGIVIYGLVLIHPTLYLLITYQVTKNIADVISAMLPSFDTAQDTLIVFGRTAVVLLTISVTAAYFRTKPFFRKNWKAFHILNYLVFYSVFYHARVGSDLGSQPFDTFYWFAFFIVSVLAIYKLFYPRVSLLFQKRLNQGNI